MLRYTVEVDGKVMVMTHYKCDAENFAYSVALQGSRVTVPERRRGGLWRWKTIQVYDLQYSRAYSEGALKRYERT